jgi:hypothetical protein
VKVLGGGAAWPQCPHLPTPLAVAVTVTPQKIETTELLYSADFFISSFLSGVMDQSQIMHRHVTPSNHSVNIDVSILEE